MPDRSQSIPGRLQRIPGRLEESQGRLHRTQDWLESIAGRVERTGGRLDAVARLLTCMPGGTPCERHDAGVQGRRQGGVAGVAETLI